MVRILLQACWQEIPPNTDLRYLSVNSCRKKFDLQGIFMLKLDAQKWAWAARKHGNYARVLPLPAFLQKQFGDRYRWGVWVHEIHAGTVSQVKVEG